MRFNVYYFPLQMRSNTSNRIKRTNALNQLIAAR